MLPAAMERVRRKLAGSAEGDRQMVDILSAELTDGLPAVEASRAEALDQPKAQSGRMSATHSAFKFLEAAITSPCVV